MKINRNPQGRRGSLSGLLIVALLCISALLFAASFKAAPEESQQGAQLIQTPTRATSTRAAPAITLTVTTTNDSGTGSLRQALDNIAQDGDTIQFDPSLNGQTIALTSAELIINKSITITGPGPGLLSVSRVTQAANFRILHIMPHTVTISGLTISGGYLENANGAGIFNDHGMLTLSNCSISGNGINASADTTGGAGIFNNGTLSLINSSVSNNSAFGNQSAGGGGIGNGGALEILNSSITGNATISFGGGIAGSSQTITNSTISGNVGFHGGGIAGGGNITHTTFSDNSSPEGGSIYAFVSALELGNNILKAVTSSTNIFNNGTAIVSHGYNLSSDNGGGFLTGDGDQINTDPLLGPLQNNGGPTFTHELLTGSPAINAGDPNFTPPPFTDQRGYPRVFNGRIDIGSLEVQPAPTPTTTPTATHFAVTAPKFVGQGSPFSFTVTAQDQFNNTVPNYPGTIHFTSTDTTAELPPDSTLTNGTGTFNATLHMVAERTITATDTSNASITGTSNIIFVEPFEPTPPPSPTPTPPSPSPTCVPVQGFDDITTLPGAGWVLTNHSAVVGTTNWFQGNSAQFPAQSGAATSYIGANFNNTTGTNTISNWLLTPPMTLRNGQTLFFWTRTVATPAFPDRLQVRMSTNGASSNVGTTATDVGDFTTLLLDINPTYTTTGYPIVWTQFTVTVTGVPSATLGRLAFRYFVENGGPTGANSDYIGIDTVVYDTCELVVTPSPTPTATATPTPTPSPTATATATPTSTPTPTATPCTGTIVWGENFDGVAAPALPPGWVATNPDPGDGTPWVTSTTTPDTAPNAAFLRDQDGISDKVLDSPPITIPTTTSVLRFRNNFNTEFSAGIYCDGGVLEVSSPNISGGEFLDITDSLVGGSFVSGGYTGDIGCGPLAGRMGWVGDSSGYIDTVINLGSNLAGQTVTFRLRFVSDEAVAAPGWRVDTMVITDGVCATPAPSPTATATASISSTPTPSPSPARALNLSTRMLVQTDANVGIGGFIITGSSPKQVLVRAIGPSLAQFGVPNFLADPVMELHGPAGFATITNDNWRDTQEAEIIATGLAPTDDLESAILATVDPGSYTAIVKSKDNTTGVGLIEVYDLGPATSQLGNISTRAFVGSSGDVMIGGFILGGGSNTTVVIRGIGPSLTPFGIPNALADPTLELRDSNGALLAENDNCNGARLVPHPNDDRPLPGSPCPPFCGGGSCPSSFCTGSLLESCISISLQPGIYTAILAGKNGGTGVGLVEIYNLN